MTVATQKTSTLSRAADFIVGFVNRSAAYSVGMPLGLALGSATRSDLTGTYLQNLLPMLALVIGMMLPLFVASKLIGTRVQRSKGQILGMQPVNLMMLISSLLIVLAFSMVF